MNPEVWLNEKLWCGFSEYRTRRAIIWRFTVEGLLPFLASNGYTVEVTPREFSSGIATLLFHTRAHTLLTPFPMNRQDDYSIEHKQHYNHVIDPMRWSAFWDTWALWEDISTEYGRGFYRRLDIQEYCWSQIDLASSPQTRIVEAHIEGDEPHSHVYAKDENEEY
jgi:hypothetical protein